MRGGLGMHGGAWGGGIEGGGAGLDPWGLAGGMNQFFPAGGDLGGAAAAGRGGGGGMAGRPQNYGAGDGGGLVKGLSSRALSHLFQQGFDGGGYGGGSWGRGEAEQGRGADKRWGEDDDRNGGSDKSSKRSRN